MSAVQGKVAVITGASQGIGAAVAKYLAARGAKVVLAARSAAKIDALAQEINAASPTPKTVTALAVPTDVADYAQMRALFDATLETFGRCDVLINNAGRIDPVARLEDSDPAEWSTTVDINLKGVYYGMQLATKHLEKGGTVINISSGAATSALEGWSHYCATKAAVLMLTKCGQKEFGADTMRVVGLSPGTVATEMQVVIKNSGINPVSRLDPSVHIPPEYVAKAVEFLCGPGGDDYLGADFSIKTDAGRAAVGLPPVAAK
mmetsp:Transcript_14230/g.56720  ORF Transcript_14230/g.56720 Transcript_14230/m.56720 type:complete len:262 (+) Transcript_14230:309-1094(+)